MKLATARGAQGALDRGSNLRELRNARRVQQKRVNINANVRTIAASARVDLDLEQACGSC
jgi:hypothetical protein